MKILGIDPAMRVTGVVILDSEIKAPPHRLYGWDWKQNEDHYLRCADAQATKLVALVEKHKPEFAVLEGYVLGPSSASSSVAMISNGTVLRYTLWHLGVPFMEVAPTALKKFVTGAANAPKEMMVAHVLKRWGWLADSQHTADAYGLAMIGLVCKGLYPGETAAFQKEVLKALESTPVFS